MSRLTVRLPASIKQGLTLLSGATVAQFIPVLASPAITRLFRPDDVGTFAIAVAAFGVLAPVACLRYDLAIMLPEEDADATHLTALCLAIGVGAAFALFLGLMAAGPFVHGTEARAIVALLLMMLPSAILLLTLQLVGQNWSLRVHNYPVQSWAAITQAFVTIGVQMVLGAMWGSSAFALVIGTVAGYLASVGLYLPVFRKYIIPNLRSHYSRGATLMAARGYKRFPLFTGPYALLGQVSARSVVLVLAALAPATVVGQFAVAQRVIILPVATLMAAASQIFYSRAARRLEDARMSHMVRTALIAGPLIVGPFFLLFTLFAEPIFKTVFGPAWGQAGAFAAVLAMPSMVKTLTVWLDRVFDIRGRQGLSLALEATYAVTGCCATYIVLRVSHRPDCAIAVYSAVTVAYLLIWTYFALKVGGFSVRMTGEFAVVAAAMSGIMVIANSLITRSGAAFPIRVLCTTLLALTLCGVGLRIAARRMRAMGGLAANAHGSG